VPAGLGLDVGSVARTILDGLVSHYAAADGIDLPERRFIAPGQPELVAWDCPCAIVTCSGIGLGPAPGVGGLPQRTGNPISAAGLRHVIFAVQIVRQVPESTGGGLKPPPVERLTAAGLLIMRDAGLLSQALVDIATAVDRQVVQGIISPGAVNTVGPEGGFAGNQASLAVTAPMLA
jgi:hypothetical protein